MTIARVPQDAKRFLDAKELLSSQLLPVTREQGRLSRAPPLCLEGSPEGQQQKMAGNSMNAACIGAFLLAAILCFDPL